MRLLGMIFLATIIFCSIEDSAASIGPELLERLETARPDETIPVIVCMKDQASEQYLLSGTEHIFRSASREVIISRLKEFSQTSQKELLELTEMWEASGSCKDVYSYWIFNGIRGSFSADAIRTLSENPGVAVVTIDGEPMKPASELKRLEEAPLAVAPSDTSWASRQVHAPEIWRLGYKGQGVVVGLVDTGVNYNHQDLVNRLWHNEDEIPNNGVDDDGNGYIDDYIGFDFGGRTGDPMDYDGHGTWCASIVLGDGTAGKLTGAAPEANVICCKWGGGMGTVWEAFQYCAANGADIVSASVGYLHGSGSVAARSICDNLLFLGVVLSAAAGNGAHNNNDHEPAPYDIVSPGVVPSPWSSPSGKSAAITVGATGSGDVRASFSSWGPTVWSFSYPYDDYPYPPGLMKPDVCAPGVGVPGASYSNNQGYVFADGTSAATPCNAGVMALMLSANSSLSPLEIDSILETTAKELGPPGKDSLYGAGRVDALMAIASSQMCWLTNTSHQIRDGGGDGDGRPEAGETDSLVVTYFNEPLWRDASSVSLQLGCSDPDISILQGTSNIGPILAGDSTDNLSNPFVFTVAPGFEARKVSFEISISATPASYDTTDTITMMVGHPYVLLVDDDNGGFYEQFYQGALDRISVVYDDWDTKVLGNVGAALDQYCLVIWFTGDMAESTLTSEERASLTSYLDNGGLLLLSGQNIGQEIGSTSFYSDYLHASFIQPTTNVHTLDGVPGDEIGDGLKVLTAGSPGAGNQTSQDIISPLAGADSVIMYLPGDCAAVKYDGGTYRIVYLGFGFEGVASRPDIGFDNNWHVLRRAISWLGCPEVGVEEETDVWRVGPDARLFQNTPNPFSTATTIRFSVGDTGPVLVNLSVYDAAGRLIERLIEGREEYGVVSTSFDAANLPTGVYFCRLEVGSRSLCRKMIVLK